MQNQTTNPAPQRVLITDAVNSPTEFYSALGRIRGCVCPAPKNLDSLVEFVRVNHVGDIVAAQWNIDIEETINILRALTSVDVRLHR